MRKLTLDRARKRQTKPVNSSRVERVYASQLKAVARNIGMIVNGYDPTDPLSYSIIGNLLNMYAEALEPWAAITAKRMLESASNEDLKGWRKITQEIGLGIKEEIATAPTGAAMRKLMNEQITLIKSLPIEAAQRVHELAIRSLDNGERAATYVEEIMRTGEVTRSRAMLIARTEVSRATTTFTQARAEYAGSEGYIWRTAHDGDVRKSHKAMEGRFVRWDSPPTLDNLTGHAGSVPNCRCYPEVVLKDE